MKALGLFLERCFSGTFEPCFVVQEDGHSGSEQLIPLAEQQTNLCNSSAKSVISDMRLKGIFVTEQLEIRATREVASITISLCLKDTPYHGAVHPYLPIGGFPRELMNESDELGESMHIVRQFRSSSVLMVMGQVLRQAWM
jgi:hypothetical protein